MIAGRRGTGLAACVVTVDACSTVASCAATVSSCTSALPSWALTRPAASDSGVNRRTCRPSWARSSSRASMTSASWEARSSSPPAWAVMSCTRRLFSDVTADWYSTVGLVSSVSARNSSMSRWAPS